MPARDNKNDLLGTHKATNRNRESRIEAFQQAAKRKEVHVEKRKRQEKEKREREEKDAVLTLLTVPQVVQPGAVEARALLPSFLYLPGPGEVPAGSPKSRAAALPAGITSRPSGRIWTESFATRGTPSCGHSVSVPAPHRCAVK